MNRLISIIKNWYLLIILQILIAIFSYVHFNNDSTKQLVLKDISEIKVFSPDWGISADLISLGIIPVAVANQKDYNSWVRDPLISKSSIEVGLRYQPNPELMANIDLDTIVDNGFYINNRSIYNKNVDIKSVEYGRDTKKIDDVPQWSTFATDMTKLGGYVNKSNVAEKYLLKSKQAITKAGFNIKKKLGNNRQFLVVNLQGTSELQVYNINHSVNLAMTIMDLKLLRMGKLTKWGMSSVPFHKIYDVPKNTCLVIVDPLSPFVEHELKESLIWQQSQFSKKNACVYRIKPVWMFGGFSTIKSFALNLEQEIINSRRTNLSKSNVEEQQ